MEKKEGERKKKEKQGDLDDAREITAVWILEVIKSNNSLRF